MSSFVDTLLQIAAASEHSMVLKTKIDKKRSAASALGWETRRKNAAKLKVSATRKKKK